MTNMLKKLINWSVVNLSEMTCYKIHTLSPLIHKWCWNLFHSFSSLRCSTHVRTSFFYELILLVLIIYQFFLLNNSIEYLVSAI